MANANIGNVVLSAVWNGTGDVTEGVKALKKVHVTEASTGKSYVYNGTSFVEDKTTTLIKYETVTLTFTGTNLSQVPGWYEVKVFASATTISDTQYDLLRLGTDVTEGYIGNYNYTSHVGDDVSLGYIHINGEGVISYADTKGGTERNTGLIFYYSVSPQFDNSNASNLDNESNNYGSIAAKFGNVETVG